MCYYGKISDQLKKKGDWYYLFFPEVDKIEMEKVEFKAPICCGRKMLFAPTDCGNPMWVCDICEKSREVE